MKIRMMLVSLAVLAGIAVGVAGTVAAVSAGGATGHVAERIAEDDPRWDCHTMGNQVCGLSAFTVAMSDGSRETVCAFSMEDAADVMGDGFEWVTFNPAADGTCR